MKKISSNTVYNILNLLAYTLLLGSIILFFSLCHNNSKFEDARRHIHDMSYIAFKNQQKDMYKIIQHFHVEYFLLAVTKEGRDIPVGKISTISLSDQYVFGPYSSETRFIYDFLVKIVNNEASLFYAQFNRIPTEDEMDSLLSEVPYYAYLLSAQDALYDMEWLSATASRSRYFLGYTEEALQRLQNNFERKKRKMNDLLLQNPSRMTISTINIM